MRLHGFDISLLIKNHLLSLHNADLSRYPVLDQECVCFPHAVQKKICISSCEKLIAPEAPKLLHVTKLRHFQENPSFN